MAEHTSLIGPPTRPSNVKPKGRKKLNHDSSWRCVKRMRKVDVCRKNRTFPNFTDFEIVAGKTNWNSTGTGDT
ncbi:hypothetical protein F2Q69_00027703 [Brassica cretica]|uniref:Uncharacterized protein n=1 Tax=Brassica cretica TaxID=69181 RepID=A0A8S9RTY4_BRACR|nr:hypothetical protein F2Q69_00027703 [Brassica cretica]